MVIKLDENRNYIIINDKEASYSATFLYILALLWSLIRHDSGIFSPFPASLVADFVDLWPDVWAREEVCTAVCWKLSRNVASSGDLKKSEY